MPRGPAESGVMTVQHLPGEAAEVVQSAALPAPVRVAYERARPGSGPHARSGRRGSGAWLRRRARLSVPRRTGSRPIAVTPSATRSRMTEPQPRALDTHTSI